MADTSSSIKKDPALRRFERAKTRRAMWNSVLTDAYGVTLPQYESPADKTATKGEKRGAKIYDSTAPDALEERSNRTRGMLFPKGRQWLFVRPEAAEANAQVARLAESVFDITQAAFEVSNFQTEIHLSIRDSYISTGSVSLDTGTEASPLAFEAVPVSQITPEENSDGKIRSNFREYELACHEITHRIPDAKGFPADIQQKIDDQKDDKIAFIECQVYEPKAETTTYKLFLKEGEKLVQEDKFDVGRQITFRVDKIPGETMGRGPVLRAIPDIMTANKVVELILKNASIAVTGIWQADDDGVLNPANISLKPGTIIPKAVGSAGLTPLEAPGRFDVSQIVLGDLRQNIRRVIYGPALPPEEGGIRTAYEIGERKANMLSVEVPSLDRMEDELFRPLVRRALYVLTDPALAASTYFIRVPDGFTRTEFVDVLMEVLETPTERAKRQVEAQEHTIALQTAIQIDPEGASRVLKMPDYWSSWFKNAGMDNSLIKSSDEQEAEQAQAEQEQEQAQLMELVASAAQGGGAQGGPRA